MAMVDQLRYNYTGGVFTNSTPGDGHLITIVGWGEEADNTKYWVVKNTVG